MSYKEVNGCLFKWELKNFAFSNHDTREFIKSSSFCPEGTNKKWSIRLYPRGERGNGFISLYLCREDFAENGAETVEITFNIELVDASRSKILESLEGKNQLIKRDWGKTDFFKRAGVIKDIEETNRDILTVYCYIFDINGRKLKSWECEALTTIQVNRHVFKWNVAYSNQTIDSKENISFPNIARFDFILSKSESNMKLAICRTEAVHPESHFVEFKLTLLTVDGRRARSCRYTILFTSGTKTNKCEFTVFLTSSEIDSNESRYLQNGFLVFLCEFSCSGGMVTELRPDSTTATSVFPTLQEDSFSMFQNKKHCDIKLQVAGEIVEAHKYILASRSPVFSSIFERASSSCSSANKTPPRNRKKLDQIKLEQNSCSCSSANKTPRRKSKKHEQSMLEIQTGIVTIPNMDGSTLKSFLEFLHTDRATNMTYECARDLLRAGHEYKVPRLKEECAVILKSKLSIENACEVLKLAGEVGHNDLKSFSLDFIVDNMNSILKDPEWFPWMKSNNKLANEIFLRVAENGTSK